MLAKSPARVSYGQMSPELRRLLRPRLERLGYVGEFFQYAAHQPQALAGFITFSDELGHALPARLFEVIALTVATETENDYERFQHEHRALHLGLTEGEISAITSGTVELSGGFSEAEITAAKLASCIVHSHGRACGAASDRLVGLLGEEGAAAAVMTAARYLAHAAMSNAWRVTPPVESPITSAQAND